MKTAFLKISRLATAIRAHFVRRQYRRPAATPGEGQTASLPVAASGFAHDLNNLLTLIVMNSQLGLQESQEAESRQRWLEVLEAGQLAADLTRQFVDASRQQHQELQEVSPNAVVRDARELLARLAGNRVAIQTQLADDAGVILISPIELLQILMNLILNARDAMPSGGTLNIETARKYLHPDSRNGTAGIRGGWYFILTVTDNGRGIEEEARSRIFETFFSTKPTGEGAGLGLAIVNAIIRKYGGQISVKTQLGAGTSFHLYFPVGGAS